jgi:hypothetical protein
MVNKRSSVRRARALRDSPYLRRTLWSMPNEVIRSGLDLNGDVV